MAEVPESIAQVLGHMETVFFGGGVGGTRVPTSQEGQT
jgi:hypothetical protein